MRHLKSLRRFVSGILFCGTGLALILASTNLFAWMRETDLMFGHFKGPPRFILNAAFWAAGTTGLAVTGIVAQLIPMVRKGSRAPVETARPWIFSALGMGTWILMLGAGSLVWTIAAAEAPYAKLQLRRDAVEQIQAGDPDAMARAKAALNSEDWLTRQRAAEAMTRLEPDQITDAVPDLVRALESGDTLVVANAAKALGKLGEAAGPAMDSLVNALDAKNDATTRVSAAQALAVIGQPAIPLFSKDLQSNDPDRQLRALFALRFFPEVPRPVLELVRPLLKHSDPSLRESAAQLWSRKSTEYGASDTIDALLIELRSNPARPDSRVIGRLQSAGWVAFEAIPMLEPLLDSPEPRQRLQAARAIWSISGRSQPLLDLTSEMLRSDPSVQVSAVLALQGLGPLAEKQLDSLEPLKHHSDSMLASLARQAVPRIQRESIRSVEEIRGLLADESIAVVERGLYEVERRGDLVPELVPDVQRLFHHHHAGIQLRALKAVTRMGPAAIAALPDVESLTTHHRRDIRSVASRVAQALGFLGEDAPVPH